MRIKSHGLLYIITFCGLSSLWAQTSEMDSLREAVNNQKGTKKIDALNALAFRQILIDFKLASGSLEQAISLSLEDDYTKGLAEAYTYKGLCENLSGNKNSGFRLLAKGSQLAHTIGEHGIEGYALLQTGNIYRAQGSFDSAKYWYDKSFLVLKDSINPWQLSMLYRDLSRYYNLNSKPNLELSYLMRALAIREKLRDKILLTDIYVLLSQWYLNQANIEKSKEYLSQAEKLNVSASITEIRKDINYQKAIILFKEYRFQEALSILEDVKNFYLANGNLQQYVKLLLDLAEVLEKNDSYELSLKNGLEALKICEPKNFIADKVRAQLIIGRDYYRIEQAVLAYEFIEQALLSSKKNGLKTHEGSAYNMKGLLLQQENKMSEALLSFENALSIRNQLENKEDVGSTLNNMGEIYESLGLLQRALQLQEQSLAISEATLDYYGICWSALDLGSLYTKMNDFGNAKHYLDRAEKTAKSIKAVGILVYIYRKQRALLMAKGQLSEALEYTFLFEKLKDSVNSTNITNRILSLKGLYELEGKNQEIELLNKNKQTQEDQIIIQKNKIQRQQFFIIATVLGLIFLSVLVYTLYQYFKKKAALNKELQERNEEIQAQSEELSESNSSLLGLNTVLYEKQEEIQAQSEELTEANTSLIMLNMELAEKNEEMAAQAEELSEANVQFVFLNNELSIKQKELETQSEELRESYAIISELNGSLEQKVEERTKEMKQAYKELDTFFYRSSHDFRRPLTTFMGLSEVAKITVKDKSALDLFEKVKETAVNLDRMLIKLQSISDVGAHQFVYREVSMQNVFDSACDTYSDAIEQFGIRISIHVGDIKTFLSYPAFLKIIIENLVENAIQFRGRIDPYISLQAIEKFGGVEISIQDNGQGVEKEYQDRLFDMFFRGNELSKGNGLGLYIVKKAVGKLGGTLHMDSTFGAGTTISIWIPLKQANPENGS